MAEMLLYQTSKALLKLTCFQNSKLIHQALRSVRQSLEMCHGGRVSDGPGPMTQSHWAYRPMLKEGVIFMRNQIFFIFNFLLTYTV